MGNYGSYTSSPLTKTQTHPAACDPPTRTITNALDLQCQVVDALVTTMDALQDRLGTVLIPANEPTGDQAPKALSANVLDMIEYHTALLKDLSTRVSRLTERLQL